MYTSYITSSSLTGLFVPMASPTMTPRSIPPPPSPPLASPSLLFYYNGKLYRTKIIFNLTLGDNCPYRSFFTMVDPYVSPRANLITVGGSGHVINYMTRYETSVHPLGLMLREPGCENPSWVLDADTEPDVVRLDGTYVVGITNDYVIENINHGDPNYKSTGSGSLRWCFRRRDVLIRDIRFGGKCIATRCQIVKPGPGIDVYLNIIDSIDTTTAKGQEKDSNGILVGERYKSLVIQSGTRSTVIDLRPKNVRNDPMSLWHASPNNNYSQNAQIYNNVFICHTDNKVIMQPLFKDSDTERKSIATNKYTISKPDKPDFCIVLTDKKDVFNVITVIKCAVFVDIIDVGNGFVRSRVKSKSVPLPSLTPGSRYEPFVTRNHFGYMRYHENETKCDILFQKLTLQDVDTESRISDLDCIKYGIVDNDGRRRIVWSECITSAELPKIGSIRRILTDHSAQLPIVLVSIIMDYVEDYRFSITQILDPV